MKQLLARIRKPAGNLKKTSKEAEGKRNLGVCVCVTLEIVETRKGMMVEKVA